MLSNIRKLVNRITLYAAAVGMFMLVIMMFLTTSDAISRKLFVPIPAAYELNQYMLAVFGLLGIAYVQQTRGHVSIGLLIERMPLRTQFVIGSIITFISVLVFSLVIWWGWVEGIFSMKAGTASDILRIPVFPFKLLVSVGAFLLVLELLLTLIDNIRNALSATSPDKEIEA